MEPYNQMETREGFLWATGRLAGDARVWYESQMQFAPVDTWSDLQPLILAEFESVTVERGARKKLDELHQSGDVQQCCTEFRRCCTLLPLLPDAEKIYLFRERLCKPLQRQGLCFDSGDEASSLQTGFPSGPRVFSAGRCGPERAGSWAACGTCWAACQPGPGRCWTCGRSGHFARNCTVSSGLPAMHSGPSRVLHQRGSSAMPSGRGAAVHAVEADDAQQQADLGEHYREGFESVAGNEQA